MAVKSCISSYILHIFALFGIVVVKCGIMSGYKPQRILSYVVASDNGLAPNVTGGICTLTVCKPVVRKVAEIGRDLIVGMSTAPEERNNVIYAMQVDEKIPLAQYFHDPRFECKKPGADVKGDNFFAIRNGRLQVEFDNAAHAGKADKIARDLKSPFALVGNRFWYFGANAPLLPSRLRDSSISLPDAFRRGHRVISDPEQIACFMNWLGKVPPGVHGQPRDKVPAP